MPAHCRRQPAGGPAGSARMSPRRAGTAASVAPSPSRSGNGRAGPRLGPERAIPRCVRSFQITAGSCSVDQPQPTPTMRARQNIKRKRPVHERRPAPGARTTLHCRALRASGLRRRQSRGLGCHAPVRDHAREPAGTRGQQTMAKAGSSPAAASSPPAAPTTPRATSSPPDGANRNAAPTGANLNAGRTVTRSARHGPSIAHGGVPGYRGRRHE